MTSVFSWQNCLRHCPASFCTPRPNLTVTRGVSWLPTFALQFPRIKKTSFLVLILEGLVGLQRTVQLQLLQRYWLGRRLGWCHIEWVAVETDRGHSVILQTAPKHCTSDSFADHDGYSTSSKGFLPTVGDIMVIWVKIHPFQSILVHWVLKCQRSLLPSPVWSLPICLDSWA